MHRLALLLLLSACARQPPRSVEPLQGVVWWDDPATDDGCQLWSFVPHDWGHSLERQWVERGDGWSRTVRVFYNLDETEAAPAMYAPGWEYRWIEAPGPDATSMPGERGALGYVTGFCALEVDRDGIVWAEAACDEVTETTPRERWARKRRHCVPRD